MRSSGLRYASHLGIRGTHEPLFVATVASDDPVDHIAYAAEQGFAGVEDNFFKSRPPAEQRRMGEAFARHGLEMGCMISAIAPGPAFWGRADEEARAALDHEIASSIEAAKRGGGRYVVIAPARDLRVPSSYQLAALVAHLRRLAPVAERAGVFLCLETTSEQRLPGQLLRHVADAFLVTQAVASPAVRLLLDLYHVQMMDGNVVDHLDRVWPDVAIVQIADVPGRSEIGIGEVNWRTVLRAIKARGYRGLIEYEIYPRGSGAAGEQAALAALRAVDADL